MSSDLLKTLVTSLISKLDVEVTKVEVSDGHRTVVSVESLDSKRLIGPHGEHLRALNTIARRLVETKLGEPARPDDRGRSVGEAANFLVDVNGYHEEKMETVRQNARMLAQRARLFKHDVELPAMSSYERLVVHELFSDDPEIKTESEGEGKFRHIVLKYRERESSSRV